MLLVPQAGEVVRREALDRVDAQLVVRREDVEAALELVEAHAPVAVDVELCEQRVGRVVDRRRVQRAQQRARRDDAPEVLAQLGRRDVAVAVAVHQREEPRDHREHFRVLLALDGRDERGEVRRGERVRRRERLRNLGRLPELPPQLRGVGVLGRGVARPRRVGRDARGPDRDRGDGLAPRDERAVVLALRVVERVVRGRAVARRGELERRHRLPARRERGEGVVERLGRRVGRAQPVVDRSRAVEEPAPRARLGRRRAPRVERVARLVERAHPLPKRALGVFAIGKARGGAHRAGSRERARTKP